MEKVRHEDECIVWTAHRNHKGYGTFDHGIAAHRWAYERWVGPIPNDLTIDHLCCNKACVRLDHLEPVTNAENTRRAMERRGNRCRRGHDLTLPGAAYTFTQTKRGVTYIGRQCLECRAITDRRGASRMAA